MRIMSLQTKDTSWVGWSEKSSPSVLLLRRQRQPYCQRKRRERGRERGDFSEDNFFFFGVLLLCTHIHTHTHACKHTLSHTHTHTRRHFHARIRIASQKLLSPKKIVTDVGVDDDERWWRRRRWLWRSALGTDGYRWSSSDGGFRLPLSSSLTLSLYPAFRHQRRICRSSKWR